MACTGFFLVLNTNTPLRLLKGLYGRIWAFKRLYYIYCLTCLFKHDILIVVGTHVLNCLIIQLIAAFIWPIKCFITG